MTAQVKKKKSRQSGFGAYFPGFKKQQVLVMGPTFSPVPSPAQAGKQRTEDTYSSYIHQIISARAMAQPVSKGCCSKSTSREEKIPPNQ